jgi:hypothetical protein
MVVLVERHGCWEIFGVIEIGGAVLLLLLMLGSGVTSGVKVTEKQNNMLGYKNLGIFFNHL